MALTGIFYIAHLRWSVGRADTSLEILSRDEMEQRRMEAAKKLLEGVRPPRVAARFGVSRTAAARWRRTLTREGVESLRKHVASGHPSRLTLEQKAQIATWVDLGPAALGQSGDRWTSVRLAQLIEERFSIHYHADYIRKLVLRVSPRAGVGVMNRGYNGLQCHTHRNTWAAEKCCHF